MNAMIFILGYVHLDERYIVIMFNMANREV